MIPLKLTRAHSPTKDTGRIFGWLVAEGAEVRSGEAVVEIELGRVTMELEAPTNGIIHIVAERGSTVPIGATLAEIRTPAEVAAATPSTPPAAAADAAQEREHEAEPEPAGVEPEKALEDLPEEPVEDEAPTVVEEREPVAAQPPAEPEPAPASEPVAAPPPATPAAQEPLATPAARRLAEELGVDLAEVTGSGPDRRILAEDVEKIAASRPATQFISAVETQESAAAAIEPKAPGPAATASQPAPEPLREPHPELEPEAEAMPEREPQPEPEPEPEARPEPEPVAAGPDVRASETWAPAAAAPSAPAVEAPAAAPALAPEAAAPRAIPRGGFYIHLGGELAADGLVEAHRTASRKFEGRTSVTDLLISVVARALTDVPELNGTIDEHGRIQSSGPVHLALTDASERAEEAPVLRNAPSLKLEEIAAERTRLAEAAQRKELRPDDLAGATSTFSNLGGYPLDFYVPSSPGTQIALITTGRVMEKPISFQRMLTIRPRMWVSVALDSRGADAEMGGRFLAALQKRLNDLPDTV